MGLFIWNIDIVLTAVLYHKHIHTYSVRIRIHAEDGQNYENSHT